MNPDSILNRCILTECSALTTTDTPLMLMPKAAGTHDSLALLALHLGQFPAEIPEHSIDGSSLLRSRAEMGERS